VIVTPTHIPDVLLVQPVVHGDHRGFFQETWHAARYAAAGIDRPFVQDNHSRSGRGTLRGLHYQIEQSQGKLVRVVAGEVYDVAVDLRRSSATFGRWVAVRLSAENFLQLWVPPGFAHGFYVTTDSADLVYKCTAYHSPRHERSLRWNDPDIGIEWPLADGTGPVLSARDSIAPSLREAECYP
jgi:dTDP-4-dehydrorhamnose 3,5-epimerase